MNIKNLTHSYVEARAFGAHADDFLNELMAKNKIYEASSSDGMLIFKCKPRALKLVEQTAAAYNIELTITGKQGQYFFFARYRKRYGAIIGAALFVAIIAVMSNYVWDINITGNVTVTDSQIMDTLSALGIRAGVPTDSFDTTKAEVSALLAMEQVSWISIERAGSRVNVKVSEGESDNPNEIALEDPCDIVAERTGRIISVDVEEGKPLCKPGEGVKAGSVLVSADTPIGPRHAAASVIAECVEQTEFFVLFEQQLPQKTGVTEKRESIIFLGMEFPLYFTPANAENSIYREQITRPKFLLFDLPFTVVSGYYEYYEPVAVTFSPQRILNQLNSQIEDYKKTFLSDAEIADENIRYLPSESGVTAILTLRYVTDIARQVKREA
jgi:similar to stage IV sporulation protein